MSANAKLDLRRPAPSLAALQQVGQAMEGKIAAALPHVLRGNATRILRCLYTEVQQSPGLLDCSLDSIFGGLIRAAQLGLEIGGPAGQSYLIPFKGRCSLVIGYKGYLQLAHRSQAVRRITPRIVREGEHFEIEYGLNQRLVHRPSPNAGPAIGYYCVIEMANGGTDFEFMSVAEAAQHRDRFALSKNGPWKTNFDEMSLKTAIRKLAKRMPLSVEMVAAATLDEQADEGVDQMLPAAVLPEELPADGVSDLEEEIQRTEAREEQK